VLRIRPLLLVRSDFEPKLVERDVQIRVLVVQACRDLGMPDYQHRLEDADDPRRGLQMVRVRLDR